MDGEDISADNKEELCRKRKEVHSKLGYYGEKKTSTLLSLDNKLKEVDLRCTNIMGICLVFLPVGLEKLNVYGCEKLEEEGEAEDSDDDAK